MLLLSVDGLHQADLERYVADHPGSEHGGEHPEDLNVPLVVSGSGAEHAVNGSSVQTTQIAPTFVRLLGLDPSALQAIRVEGTQVLPGVAR